MWRTLRNRVVSPEPEEGSEHAGLAYSRGAPRELLLKVRGEKTGEERELATIRDAWLDWVCRSRAPRGYEEAQKRWVSTSQGENTRCFVVRAVGRVLVGHGNPSPTEVGLTLHHTWGVPVLPGSSLKGLTASYVEAVYGPDPELDDADREAFRGVEWNEEETRPIRGPGRAYRRLFGAPDVVTAQGREASSSGDVLFHDALWIPGGGTARAMLARDVLTVHQAAYYSGETDKEGNRPWPCDHDDPNPVAFLSVAPGNCFWVTLEVAPGTEGGAVLLKRAERYLKEALTNWGLGGKTAAGYGRFVVDDVELAKQRASVTGAAEVVGVADEAVLTELSAWLEANRSQDQKPLFRLLETEWRARLLSLDAASRVEVARIVSKRFHFRKGGEVQERMNALLAQLRSGLSPLRG